jgi:D-alanine-D-alanine ligase-like ATP-grasp enzyme
MTEQSLLPQIAAKAGLSFDDLVEAIAHTARLKC